MHIATRWMYIATGWLHISTGQLYDLMSDKYITFVLFSDLDLAVDFFEVTSSVSDPEKSSSSTSVSTLSSSLLSVKSNCVFPFDSFFAELPDPLGLPLCLGSDFPGFSAKNCFVYLASYWQPNHLPHPFVLHGEKQNFNRIAGFDTGRRRRRHIYPALLQSQGLYVCHLIKFLLYENDDEHCL